MDIEVKICLDVGGGPAVSSFVKGPKRLSSFSFPLQSQENCAMPDVCGRKNSFCCICGLELMLFLHWRDTRWANNRVFMSTYWSMVSRSS